MKGQNRTYLIITIDTEEEGRWGNKFIRTGLTTDNILKISTLQNIFDKYKVLPTYLVDYPVVKNERNVGILNEYLSEGLCEIGAHLHPWCTPPFEEELNVFNSYPSNLSFELQMQKMEILTNLINEKFNIQPLSYRAGRFGYNKSSMKVLENLGYKVDVSVIPLSRNIYYDKNYRFAPVYPYFPSYENISKKGSCKVLEIPNSMDFVPFISKTLRDFIVSMPTKFKLEGIVRKLGISKVIWFRPSDSSFEEMKAISDMFIERNYPVLNMMFHSSEILPGESPYVKNRKELKEFLIRLERILEYLTESMDVIPVTAEKFYNIVTNNKLSIT